MKKGRMEAFSDGVIAILITIMVLELRPPQGSDLRTLLPLTPVFLSYLLSFVFLGIYWNNHHHLLQVIEQVDGRVLWANIHLLFWLSLVPFTTAWLGQNPSAPWPVALYGLVLLLAAIAYYILVHALLSLHSTGSKLSIAMGDDFKGKISIVIYLVGMLSAFFNTWLACALYVLVAVLWFVPDQRIEKVLNR